MLASKTLLLRPSETNQYICWPTAFKWLFSEFKLKLGKSWKRKRRAPRNDNESSNAFSSTSVSISNTEKDMTQTVRPPKKKTKTGNSQWNPESKPCESARGPLRENSVDHGSRRAGYLTEGSYVVGQEDILSGTIVIGYSGCGNIFKIEEH